MKTAFFLGVLAALLAGIGIGWLAHRRMESVDEESTRAEATARRVKELEAEVATLEASAREAASRALAAAGKPAPATAPSPVAPTRVAPTPAPAETPAEKDPKGPKIASENYAEVLAGVDWPVVGKSLQEMAPLLGKFAEEYEKTGKRPNADRIGELNGNLIAAAVHAATKLKIPMSKVNSAFTHPIFTANSIASALEAAGLPLSETQASDLGRLAELFSAEDAKRIAGYDDKGFELARSIEESELRERFYAAAFDLLTGEQRDALTPPNLRGRLQADLYSAGLVWMTRAQVLPFATTEALETKMTEVLVSQLEVKPEATQTARDAVGRWVRTFPPAWTTEPADALSKLGFVPLARVHEAARLQVRLAEDYLQSANPDVATATKLRKLDFVLVPLLVPTPAAPNR